MAAIFLALIAGVSLFFAVLLTAVLGVRLAQIHLKGKHELKRFTYDHQEIIMWSLALWHGGLLAFAGSIAVLVNAF